MDWNIKLEVILTSYILLGTKFRIDGDSKAIRKLRTANALDRGFEKFVREEFVYNNPYDDDDSFLDSTSLKSKTLVAAILGEASLLVLSSLSNCACILGCLSSFV